MFIGRKTELAELNRRWDGDRFEFGVIYGARRIGKTSLINEFLKGKNGFRFQARQGTADENLRAFSRLFNEFRGINSDLVYQSFDAAFDDLIRFAQKERFVFVIDEIAYLCSHGKNFLSLLQNYVDGPFADAGMMLILSGSNISFMEDILNNKGDPLYKRATFEMNVKKLPFSEALQFVRKAPSAERAAYLSVFGCYPYYLSMLDLNVSFEDNLRHLLFSQFGALSDAPEKVLPGGTSEQSIYNTILRALAKGKCLSKEIADYVGEDANYLAKYLSNLVNMQVIEKRESFTRNKKMNYYAISDNLIRFWYRFIYESRDLIQLGAGDRILNNRSEQIKAYIARGTEDSVIEYLTEQNIRGKLPDFYGVIRNYKVENSALGRSIEIDGMAESVMSKGSLMVIECKYRNSSFSEKMLEHLKESASVFKAERIDYYLFSKSGFSDSMLENADENIHLLAMKDVFGE